MPEPLDPYLLDILRCPVCIAPVPLKDDRRLVCVQCGRAYAIEDGIPNMKTEDATFEPGFGSEATP